MAEQVPPSAAPLSLDTCPAQIRNSTFVDPLSSANVAAWSLSPLTVVASSVGGVNAYPCGADIASQSGVKTQRFTSFSSSSSSYLCALSVRYTVEENEDGPVVAAQPQSMVTVVIPTQAQLASLTKKQRQYIQQGRLVFTSLGKAMTPSALEQENAPTHRTKARTSLNQTTAGMNRSLTFKSITAEELLYTKPESVSDCVLMEQAKKAEVERNQKLNDGVPSTSQAAQAAQTKNKQEESAGKGEERSASLSPKTETGSSPPHSCSKRFEVDLGDGDAHDCVDIRQIGSVSHIPSQVVSVSHISDPTLVASTPYTQLYSTFAQSLSSDSETAIRATVKNPAIRDTTTWMLAVRSLMHETGSYLDVAPMLRVALLATAVSQDYLHADATTLTFVRNITTRPKRISVVTPPDRSPDGSIIAMPIDIFLLYMADGSVTDMTTPPDFQPNGCDSTWTAVPVTNALLSTTYLSTYVLSFLTSEYTYGTVNHSHSYRTVGSTKIKGSFTTIPASNLVHVPGAASAIIVLTDVSAETAPTSIHLAGLSVPVYSPRRTNRRIIMVDPLPVQMALQQIYSNDLLHQLSQDLVLCWNYMTSNLAVGNTAGMALSLAAELSMIRRPGMAVAPDQENLRYNTSISLAGGWYLTNLRESDPIPIDITGSSPYKLEPLYAFNAPGTDDDDADELLALAEGFNLASYSPHHLAPSGVVQVGVVGAHTPHYITTDSEPNPLTSTPQYRITTASSLKRVAISIGLISLGLREYIFATAAGFATWIHTLAHAQYGNVAAFLLLNDIPLRDWAGYNNTWDDYSRLSELQAIKTELTAFGLIHLNTVELHRAWGLPNDLIADFFGGIDPYNNREWGGQSPVAFHFLQQWMEKLKIAQVPTAFPQNTLVSVGRIRKYALPLRVDDRVGAFYASGSYEISAEHPILLDLTFQSVRPRPMCISWVEQESFISLMLPDRANEVAPRAALETLALTEAHHLTFTQPSNLRSLALINTPALTSSWSFRTPKVTPLSWPDPPSALDIINAAKNYVLIPALAALTGFAAGGPVGAAISAGGTIVGQVLSDSLESREKERLKKEVTADLARMHLAERAQTPNAPSVPNPEAPQVQ